MIPDQCKKFHGRHLERNRNILIGIHHNHIIRFVGYIQVSTSVIRNDLYFFGHLKIHFRQFCDFFIDFYARDDGMIKIPDTLGGKCPGSVAKNKYPQVFLFHSPRHQRRRQGIIIIHACEAVVFFADRLHAEQHVCG